jgi:error-prone DNA polymerase
LRKAMGDKRSDAILARMKFRLIKGMTANGIALNVQPEILRRLSTVREFMFPEPHAHNFASIADSSTYAKLHYFAAYTCALLIKDRTAQRYEAFPMLA